MYCSSLSIKNFFFADVEKCVLLVKRIESIRAAKSAVEKDAEKTKNRIETLSKEQIVWAEAVDKEAGICA